MLYIIKNASLIHPQHPLNQQKVDVLWENGVLKKIGSNLKAESAQIIEGKDLMLCAGFTDIGAEFCDPGFEHRETIQSGLNAAKYGGFTRVAIHPNTQPALDSKAAVQYVLKSSAGHIVSALPLGSISEGNKEKEIAEYHDMHLAGAVAFSNARNPIQDTALMSRALLYAKGIDALLIHRPEDQFLAGTAMVNESEQTVNLGMKGIPILAESIMLQRDIALAKYHNTRIHIHHVSTAESLEMIKEAKKQGVQITCDVSMNHLLFDDAMLSSFEEHFKVKPPLRTKKDQKALIEGLKSGIIDAIVSQHSPKDIESKNVEFQIASFGNIGLQQCFPALFEQLSNTLGLETLVKALSSGPNKILGLANPDFVEGETANFVLIDQNNPWSMNAANNQSTSFNSPFVNAQFKARVVAMAHNQQFEILHYA